MIGLDWIILAILALGAFFGLRKGFLRQLVSFTGFFVGLLVACLLYAVLGDKLAPALGTSATTGHVFAFILIWVAVPGVLSVVASMFTRLLKTISLGWLDGALGVVIGVLKYALFISIFINMLQLLDFHDHVISKEKKEASAMYYPIGKMVKFLVPHHKDADRKEYK